MHSCGILLDGTGWQKILVIFFWVVMGCCGVFLGDNLSLWDLS